MAKVRRRPVVGPDFDTHQMAEGDRIRAYITTLNWYQPSGYTLLVVEGEKLLPMVDAADTRADAFDNTPYEGVSEWMQKCDECLTSWAQLTERNQYIIFGPFQDTGDVGFYYDVESALSDADLKIAAGDTPPKAFTGLLAEVTDHGNVTVSTYSRGRRSRELFSVV